MGHPVVLAIHDRTSMRRDPYVMPHERRVLTLRQHPLVILWKQAGTVILAVAFASWLTIASTIEWWLPWTLVLVALGYLGWQLLHWGMTYLVLTNLRLLVVDGVFVRRVSMVPLVKVVDMSFERPLLGVPLNYGRLIVESAHEGHPLNRIGALPRIDEVYHTICGMLFSDLEDEATRDNNS